jgi:hypothetical protein
LSYPALYTHKRNKHNIIPITGKPEIFKSNTLNTKFRYNAMDNTNNVEATIEGIFDIYKVLCQEYFMNPESVFHKPNFVPENDKFLKQLQKYKIQGIEKDKEDKIIIPKPEDKLNKIKIDNVLIVYLILLIEVTREKVFSDLIVKFAFLFREYLNLAGWEYKKLLSEYNLSTSVNIRDDYTNCNSCEEIPELVNDFISVFMEMDDSFSPNTKDMTDMCQNFCYWLFINGLTNYKLVKFDNQA